VWFEASTVLESKPDHPPPLVFAIVNAPSGSQNDCVEHQENKKFTIGGSGDGLGDGDGTRIKRS